MRANPVAGIIARPRRASFRRPRASARLGTLGGEADGVSYILLTIAFWAAFFVAVRPGEWRAYYPLVLFGGLLGTLSDLIGVTTYQWHYFGPTTGGLSLWSDLGVAPAQAGLFAWSLRRYPRWRWVLWLFWTAGNAAGEWLFVQRDWILYGYWHPLKAFLFYVGFFLCLRLHERFVGWLEGAH